MNKTEQHWNKAFASGKKFTPMNVLFFSALLKRIAALRGKSTTSALDLGCGTGELLRMLAGHDIEATGVDISSAALEDARIKAVEENLDITLHLMDLETIDAAALTNQFDIIFCKLTIAFINDQQRFLQSVRSLMQPDRIFILIAPVLVHGIEYNTHLRAISTEKAALEQLLQDTFPAVEMFYKHYFAKKGLSITYLCHVNPA